MSDSSGGGRSGDEARDALLAERYGQAPRRSWWLTLGAIVVVAVVGLSWLGWAAWRHATPDVRGELESYEVTSDHQVHVVIAADRSSGDAIECLVRALAADHSTVGEEVVTIPSGESGDLRYEVDITTDRAATAASVTECRLAD